MHERYLLMAVFLTLAAAAVRANRQLLAIGCTLGVAAWLNMLLVVNASTSQDLFLLQGLPAFALRATALAVLLCVCMLLWLAVRLSLWPARDEPLQAAQLQNFAPMVGLRVLLARRAARRQPMGPCRCAGQGASLPFFLPAPWPWAPFRLRALATRLRRKPL